MYTNTELIKKFRKFLRVEMETIIFYLENLDDCNYEKNKEAINKLILESIDHQKLLAQGLLSLQQQNGALTQDIKLSALREETGMKELYQYTIKGTDNNTAKKILERLVTWEKEHEKLAKGLR